LIVKFEETVGFITYKNLRNLRNLRM